MSDWLFNPGVDITVAFAVGLSLGMFIRAVFPKRETVEVEKIVEVKIPVDRVVEVVVEKPVEVLVEKIVEVPVDRIVEKIVEVEKVVKVPAVVKPKPTPVKRTKKA